jgi:hypothetical protein
MKIRGLRRVMVCATVESVKVKSTTVNEIVIRLLRECLVKYIQRHLHYNIHSNVHPKDVYGLFKQVNLSVHIGYRNW